MLHNVGPGPKFVGTSRYLSGVPGKSKQDERSLGSLTGPSKGQADFFSLSILIIGSFAKREVSSYK